MTSLRTTSFSGFFLKFNVQSSEQVSSSNSLLRCHRIGGYLFKPPIQSNDPIQSSAYLKSKNTRLLMSPYKLRSLLDPGQKVNPINFVESIKNARLFPATVKQIQNSNQTMVLCFNSIKYLIELLPSTHTGTLPNELNTLKLPCLH